MPRLNWILGAGSIFHNYGTDHWPGLHWGKPLHLVPVLTLPIQGDDYQGFDQGKWTKTARSYRLRK